MTVHPLGFREAQEVARWRNKCRDFLRTPTLSGYESQKEFMTKINKPHSKIHYWWFADMEYTAAGGLVNMDWWNRRAEIAIIVNPDNQRKGLGTQVCDWILSEAFNNMGLEQVWGECYMISGNAFPFWKTWLDSVRKYSYGSCIYETELESVKRYKNERYDSYYFSINK